MTNKQIAALCAVSAIVGGVLVKKFSPTVEHLEKEVIKEKIVTVIHKVKSPDGTIITDVTRTEDKTSDSLRLTTAKPNWIIGAGLVSDGTYNALVQRRFAGPVFIGLSGGMKGVTMRDGLELSPNIGLWISGEF